MNKITKKNSINKNNKFKNVIDGLEEGEGIIENIISSGMNKFYDKQN